MTPLKIPKTFRMGGRKWTVHMRRYRKKWFGLTDGARCEIRLNLSVNRDAEELMHTWVHELVHAACYSSGQMELNKNEYLVDALGGLLAQALTTGEGKAKVG